jgi:hypothetical protein
MVMCGYRRVEDARRETPADVISGGRSSYTEIGNFLRNGASGPEHQALLQLIGTLLEGCPAGTSGNGERVRSLG